MATRGSDRWRHDEWGSPCALLDPVNVIVGGHPYRVDKRTVPAWYWLDFVLEKHGYFVHREQTGSYNCRHIGSDSNRPWSAHAWTLAFDINWNQNPDGSRLRTNMPKPMRDELMTLRTVDTNAPVLRWGGDWDRDPRTGHSYYDAMHWEIIATPAELNEGVYNPLELPEQPEDEDMSALQMERLANGYNAVRGNYHSWREAFYDPRRQDPQGWVYWIGRMHREDPVAVVDEALAILAHEAGL